MAVPYRDSSPPKAILFDVGRVIVRISVARAFAPIAAALGGAGKTGPEVNPNPEQIWTAIQSAPRWRDWQEGRLTPEQWHDYVTKRLDMRVGFADFCAAWNSTLDPETLLQDEFFAKLGARCRLGLVSNTDPIHVEYLERHFSFVRYFPVRAYSCRMGACKPNPAIYQHALKGLGVAPAETVYVDDIAEYANAGRHLGMDPIHFQGAAQLTRELESRGIRTP